MSVNRTDLPNRAHTPDCGGRGKDKEETPRLVRRWNGGSHEPGARPQGVGRHVACSYEKSEAMRDKYPEKRKNADHGRGGYWGGGGGGGGVYEDEVRLETNRKDDNFNYKRYPLRTRQGITDRGAR